MSSLHVICKIGDSEYAIATDEIHQMESYTQATPVPGALPYVAGLVQIKQQILPALDLRVRFGLPETPVNLETRLVVCKIKERLVGIIVDSAREVRSIPSDEFQKPPEMVANQSAGFVKSVARIKDRIIMLLDTVKVIGEEMSHA